jgi:hypothetical protein
MDPSTLNGGTVKLVDPKTGASMPTRGTPSADGKTVTLDPYGASRQKLAKNTKYEVQIESGSGGAKDRAGNPLAQAKVWSFTTKRA